MATSFYIYYFAYFIPLLVVVAVGRTDLSAHFQQSIARTDLLAHFKQPIVANYFFIHSTTFRERGKTGEDLVEA